MHQETLPLPFEIGVAGSAADEAEHLAWFRRRMAKVAVLGAAARNAKMTRDQRRAAARHASRIRWAMYRATRNAK